MSADLSPFQDIGSSSYSVHVGNIDSSVAAEEIESHFSQCGVINSVDIPQDDGSGQSIESAYIEFADESGVLAAVKLSDTEFKGHKIILTSLVSGGFGYSSSSRGRSRGSHRGSMRGGSNSSLRSEVQEEIGESLTVLVSNLVLNATEEDIKNIFSTCGVINRIRLVHDRETGQFKGFAYVEFADHSSVLDALDFTGADYRGLDLKVNIANTRTERPADRGRGRGRYDNINIL